MKKEVVFLYRIEYNVLVHILYPKIIEFLQTLIQNGNKHLWLWICIRRVNKTEQSIHISQVRNMLILSSFLKSILNYGRHIFYSDREHVS
jgi:hypothetical protein